MEGTTIAKQKHIKKTIATILICLIGPVGAGIGRPLTNKNKCATLTQEDWPIGRLEKQRKREKEK